MNESGEGFVIGEFRVAVEEESRNIAICKFARV